MPKQVWLSVPVGIDVFAHSAAHAQGAPRACGCAPSVAVQSKASSASMADQVVMYTPTSNELTKSARDIGAFMQALQFMQVLYHRQKLCRMPSRAPGLDFESVLEHL